MNQTALGSPLAEIYSPFVIEGLYYLLSDDSDDFGVASKTGRAQYRCQTGTLKGSVIKDAIATMSGAVATGAEIAFIPPCWKGFLPASRWGGTRIPPVSDLKVGAGERRARCLLGCFRAYAYGRSLIVEECGDGSWQFWAIRNGFSAHKTWRKMLRKVSSEAGIDCEIFPSDDGVGMSAPGSWDPCSGRLSRIVYADLTAIFRVPVYSAFAGTGEATSSSLPSAVAVSS